MITRQTLDQKRAQSALARHQSYPQPDATHPACPKFWGDYSATANGLPPAIRSNGLILALAAEVARASGKLDPGQTAVLADLCAYLSEWSKGSAPGWLPDAKVPGAWQTPSNGDKGAEKAHDKWRNDIVKAAQILLEALIEADASRYQVIGEEALAYLAWLKTLAKPKANREKAREKAEAANAAAGAGGGDTPGASEP